MSNNEKTRHKLMESMRKTKAGSSSKTEQTDSNVKAQETKPVKKKTQKTDKNVPNHSTDKVTADSYQTGRRIWPD